MFPGEARTRWNRWIELAMPMEHVHYLIEGSVRYRERDFAAADALRVSGNGVVSAGRGRREESYRDGGNALPRVSYRAD